MPRCRPTTVVALACLCATVIGITAFFLAFSDRPPVVGPAPVFRPPEPVAQEKPPPYIPGTQLVLQSDSINLQDDTKTIDPIIFVEPPDIFKTVPFEESTGLLRREFYRQAFLIAASQGMGLVARDALLGEEPPENLPQGNRFRVTPEFPLARYADVKIEVGPVAASRVVWHARGVGQLQANETHLAALTAAETLSRGEYLQALNRGGMRGKSLRVIKEAKVPDAIETLLSEMTWTSQYRALRELTALLRKKGESPEILVGMSRACAHLALLTERQWDAMTWVFKARAILYAERLRQREPDSPWGLWARAHATALTGLHKIALDDIAAAGKVRGAVAVPDWIRLAEHYCRFDSPKLEEASREGRLSQSATLLHFISIESPMGRNRVVEAGGKALAKMPDCHRIHDTVEEYRTVGVPYPVKQTGFERFTEAFPEALKTIPGVPAGLAARWREDDSEEDQFRELMKVGSSREDVGEPSLGALAKFGRETRALQVMRMVQREVDRGIAPHRTYEKLRPLLEDHPLLPYMEQYGFKRSGDAQEYRALLENNPVPELSYRHEKLMGVLRQMSPVFNRTYGWVVNTHADFVHHDLFLQLRFLPDYNNFGQFAEKILAHSPCSPIARAVVIRDDWKFAAPLAAKWENESHLPEVFVLLARRSIKDQRSADAERQAKRAVELAPGRDSYLVLAEARKAGGDDEGYVEALKEFIARGQGGLELATAHAEIAFHHMKRGDYARAKPHALEASSSGLALGIDCEARCLEGLGEWDAAEALMKQLGARYDGCFHYWYFWCLRTGRGDLAAAEKKVDQFLGRVGTNRFFQEIVTAGVRRLMKGRHAIAAESFLLAEPHVVNPYFTMLAAAEYEAAGDLAKRDETFQKIPVDTPWFQLAGLLKDHGLRAVGKPVTREQMDAVFATFAEEKRTEAGHIMARFFQLRGEKAWAADYYRLTAKNHVDTTDVAGVLTAVALREIDKK